MKGAWTRTSANGVRQRKFMMIDGENIFHMQQAAKLLRRQQTLGYKCC